METILLNIDSSTNRSKFRFKLNSLIKDVIEMKISSLEIPKTQYFFNNKKDNNNFKLIIDSKKYKFQLDDGNYEIDDIYNLIKNFLNIYNINLKLENNRFTFESQFDFTIDFTNTSKYESLGKILGFQKNIYDDIKILKSENIFKINQKYLLLKINDFGNYNINNNTYFTKIDIDDDYNGEIFKFNQPINISHLNFELNDYLGNNIKLNGGNMSLTVEIKFLKNELLKKYFQNTHYDKDLIDLIVKDNMLKYYQKKITFNN